MIISKTPYRISFFGGGTDYNAWFEKNGGLVIGTSFNKYCYISIRKLPPFFEHKTRIVYSKTENTQSVDEIEHPSVRNCLKFMKINDGLEIHCNGELPARSGIGSSSSFTVGLLHALNAFQNKQIDPKNLANHAIYVDQKLSNEFVGVQDQILASYGGLQVIEMSKSDINIKPINVSEDYKKYLASHILLGFTGRTRNSSESAQEQISSILKGSLNDQMLETLSIAKEGYTSICNEADAFEIGKLMERSWKIKRTLTSKMSNSSVDSFFDRAKRLGAYGGRVMGAGGGGFILIMAPPKTHQIIQQELSFIRAWVPIKFENEGSKIIFKGKEEQPIKHNVNQLIT